MVFYLLILESHVGVSLVCWVVLDQYWHLIQCLVRIFGFCWVGSNFRDSYFVSDSFAPFVVKYGAFGICFIAK